MGVGGATEPFNVEDIANMAEFDIIFPVREFDWFQGISLMSALGLNVLSGIFRGAYDANERIEGRLEKSKLRSLSRFFKPKSLVELAASYGAMGLCFFAGADYMDNFGFWEASKEGAKWMLGPFVTHQVAYGLGFLARNIADSRQIIRYPQKGDYDSEGFDPNDVSGYEYPPNNSSPEPSKTNTPLKSSKPKYKPVSEVRKNRIQKGYLTRTDKEDFYKDFGLGNETN